LIVKPAKVGVAEVATDCPIEIVTAPVAPLTLTPVPATAEVTPALVKVTDPPNDTEPPPLIPVPAVTVTDEFANCPFVIPAVPFKLEVVKPLICEEPDIIPLVPVIVANVIVPPNDVDVPAIVIAEFANLPLEIEPANIASVTPLVAIESVLVELISPPPVKPLPADIETAVWSMCLFAEYPVVESCDTCAEPLNAPIALPITAAVIEPPKAVDVPAILIVLLVIDVPLICDEPDTIPLFPVIVANVIVPPNAVEVPAIVIVLFVIPVPLIWPEPETKFGIVISAEPLNEVPLIVLAVCKVVAVDALPVNAPVNPVEVTEVNPANVVDDAPSDIAVVPIVTELLVNCALLIPVTCDEPLIVPAGNNGVTCDEPDTIPLVPVMVANVIEPPNEVDVPAIVIALLLNDAFAILESVFDAPLIVLFVSVCVPVVVAIGNSETKGPTIQ